MMAHHRPSDHHSHLPWNLPVAVNNVMPMTAVSHAPPPFPSSAKHRSSLTCNTRCM
ncbi:hypothetical protein B0H10DRAFT_535126 [Mycena sp. CBHHK59/15]|nr:hypothetical protein B0H10DRAFT_535126 [Mycena sp. CBHHK59/15]